MRVHVHVFAETYEYLQAVIQSEGPKHDEMSYQVIYLTGLTSSGQKGVVELRNSPQMTGKATM